ncbi:hypothetical protein I6E50_13975 [Roseburia hominis]|uniref:dual OB domain-containing protein n=1 Tax=Roseburia hominis TaxID=301301 RepID=UPI001F3BCB47|nr:hypothetical protein [Roseburia hominis]
MGNIRIIIMTESSKFSKKCVAGINIDNGEWVRLVSSDKETHGAISDEDLRCFDGRKCNVLDVVNVPIIRTCGNEIQPENILMDTSKYITIEGKATLSDVLKIHSAEIRDSILGNKYSYITESKVRSVGYSLILVQVEDLVIFQVETSEGKIKTRTTFRYRGNEYQMLSVTDPNFYSIPNGTTYKNAFLVISIGTPYNNRYYKFVAKIFV